MINFGMFQIPFCIFEVGTNFASSPLGIRSRICPKCLSVNRALELEVDLVASLASRVLPISRDACNSPILRRDQTLP